MALGSMPNLRIATIEEAPQSIRTFPARPLEMKAGVEAAAAAESVAGAEEGEAHDPP